MSASRARPPGSATPGAPTSGSPAGERSYRYPGSPPFRDIDLDRRLFKGRDEEAKKVFHSILSADVFLLYAVSGMGKSSLLNAGVMHRLRERGYWPVNVRLNDTTLSPVQSIDRQIAEADIRDTEVEVQRTPGLDFDITAETTLWDLLGSLEVWRGDRLQQLVVVLDQFEELFTLDWKADVRDRFIAEFGQVVRGHRSVDGEALAETSAVPVPNVKFCIVIREDALGQLEALADDVPQIMQNRFRLGALDATQAELGDPRAGDGGRRRCSTRSRSSTARRPRVRSSTSSRRPSAPRCCISAEVDTDTSVDPSQLQIICQYIERRVLPAKGTPPDGQVVTIATDDLGGAEGLRSVLGDFYRRTVGDLPAGDATIGAAAVRRGADQQEWAASEHRTRRDRRAVRGVTAPSSTNSSTSGSCGSSLGSEAPTTNCPTTPSSGRSSPTAPNVARPRRAVAAVSRSSPPESSRCSSSGSSRIDSDSTRAATPSRRSSSRPRCSGRSSEPGDVARFQVVAREQPSLVLVEPSEDGTLNASVSADQFEEGTPRARISCGSGEAERIVVPAGTGDRLDVAVSSKDASTGGFEITQGDLTVTPLLVGDSGDDPVRGSIDEPGSLAVYSVDVTEPLDDGSDTSIEIFVSRPDEGRAVRTARRTPVSMWRSR